MTRGTIWNNLNLIKVIMARLRTQRYSRWPLDKGATNGELKIEQLQFVHRCRLDQKGKNSYT